MTTRLNPYLHVRGTAREAMEHCRSVLGGERSSRTFGDHGMQGQPAEQIMHSQLARPADVG